jgi:hypothetical protein
MPASSIKVSSRFASNGIGPVVAGARSIDPAIHQNADLMDPRVKPAGDDLCGTRPELRPAIARSPSCPIPSA